MRKKKCFVNLSYDTSSQPYQLLNDHIPKPNHGTFNNPMVWLFIPDYAIQFNFPFLFSWHFPFIIVMHDNNKLALAAMRGPDEHRHSCSHCCYKIMNEILLNIQFMDCLGMNT